MEEEVNKKIYKAKRKFTSTSKKTKSTRVYSDHYLFCQKCQLYNKDGQCKVHGRPIYVDNTVVPHHFIDGSFAILSLPDGLQVKISTIPNSNNYESLFGVFASKQFLSGTIFGPSSGRKMQPTAVLLNGNSIDMWHIMEKRRVDHIINFKDEELGNWTRYVKYSKTIHHQNLIALQYYGEVYYRAIEDIKPGTELLVWYGDHYAAQLGIDSTGNEIEVANEASVTVSTRTISNREDVIADSSDNTDNCLSADSQEQLVQNNEEKRRKKARYKKKQRPYKCNQCEMTFFKVAGLDKHKKTHVEKQMHVCNQCESEFGNKRRLTEHIITAHNEDPVLSSNRITDNQEEIIAGPSTNNDDCLTLRSDLDEEHSVEENNKTLKVTTYTKKQRLYKCDKCEMTFFKPASWIKHRRKHLTKQIHACDQCEKQFKVERELKRHKTATHNIYPTYICDECGKGFTVRRQFVAHTRLHFAKSIYNCHQCRRKYSRKNLLDQHKKKVHNKFTLFENNDQSTACTNDPLMEISTNTNITTPLSTNESTVISIEPTAPALSDTLSSNIATNNLDDDIEISSSDDSTMASYDFDALPYDYEEDDMSGICDLDTIDSSQLQDNGSNISIEQDCCKHRGKCLELMSNLQSDDQDHSNGKICNEFTHNLYQHRVCHQQETRSKHCQKRSNVGNQTEAAKISQPSYICNECGQGYFKSDELDEHKKIHTGKQCYECDKCEKEFNNINLLTKHQFTDHKRLLLTHENINEDTSNQNNSDVALINTDNPIMYTNEIAALSIGPTADVTLQETIDLSPINSNDGLIVNDNREVLHTNGEDGTSHNGDLETIDMDQSHNNTSNASEESSSCEQCGKCLTAISNLLLDELDTNGKLCEECKNGVNLDRVSSPDEISTPKHCQDDLNVCKKTKNGKKERPYICDKCGKGFFKSGRLDEHKKIHNRIFECDECYQEFEKESCLAEHKVNDHDVPLYICDDCGRGFDALRTFNAHRKTHSSTRTYECDQCGKEVASASQLKKHIATHNKIPKYICNHCGQTFTRLYIFTAHQTSHTEELPFSCDLCGRGFIERGNLTRHRRIHTGERPFPCDQCGKGCISSSDLTRHKRTHSGERPYVCEQCSKGFITKSDLTTHLRTHTGERPYVCDQCGNRFTQSRSLKAHQLTHTGERPHICDVCGKGFAVRSTLKIHMRIHTGERPYVCPICYKGFKMSSDLNRHKVTHTGEKPHICDICDKTFSQLSTLKKHKLRHT